MTFKWYVLNVYSGFEQKVKTMVFEKADELGLSANIEEILIPKENIVSYKKGKKTTSEKKFYPGYVLCKLNMNDDLWHLFSSIPKVTGFLGSQNKATPISNSEAEKILCKIDDMVSDTVSSMQFFVGETVEVVDGPFETFFGVIDAVDLEKSRVKVIVKIFERDTIVDLEFDQIQKKK